MPTILIIDDQAEILQVFSRALEMSGHRVQIAATAEVALKLVETDPPDAILLDLTMPYINGMGFLYRLRKVHPRLPVAIITGSTSLDTAAVQEIRMLDASLHFKPVSVGELQAIVDALTRTA